VGDIISFLDKHLAALGWSIMGFILGSLVVPFSRKIVSNLADRILPPKKDECLEKHKHSLTVKRDESKKEIEVLEKIREAVCAHRGAAIGFIRSMRSSTHQNTLSDPKVVGDFNHLGKTVEALHNTAFKVSRSYIPLEIYEKTEAFWALSNDQLTNALGAQTANDDKQKNIVDSAAQICELIDQRITTLRTEC
jgi:hypothetical protein